MKDLSTITALAALAATAVASSSTTYSLDNFDPKKLSAVGCYSRLNDNLNNWHTWAENSAQHCAQNCIKYYNSAVVALSKGDCFCGSDQIPPKTKRVDDKLCTYKCYSAIDEADAAISCGGHQEGEWPSYYTVVKTGLKDEVSEGHTSETEAEWIEWNAMQSSSALSSAPSSTGVAGPVGTATSISGVPSATTSSASTNAVSGTPAASVSTGSACLVNARVGVVALFGLAAYAMI